MEHVRPSELEARTARMPVIVIVEQPTWCLECGCEIKPCEQAMVVGHSMHAHTGCATARGLGAT